MTQVSASSIYSQENLRTFVFLLCSVIKLDFPTGMKERSKVDDIKIFFFSINFVHLKGNALRLFLSVLITLTVYYHFYIVLSLPNKKRMFTC